MGYALALERLAALHVPGLPTRYGLGAAPPAIARADLPALLVLLGEPQAERLLAPQDGQGFRAQAFAGGYRTAELSALHLLVVAPVAGQAPASDAPALAAWVDAYLTALAADVSLGGALAEPAQVRVELGRYVRGGVAYSGCLFRHRWLIAI